MDADQFRRRGAEPCFYPGTRERAPGGVPVRELDALYVLQEGDPRGRWQRDNPIAMDGKPGQIKLVSRLDADRHLSFRGSLIWKAFRHAGPEPECLRAARELGHAAAFARRCMGNEEPERAFNIGQVVAARRGSGQRPYGCQPELSPLCQNEDEEPK